MLNYIANLVTVTGTSMILALSLNLLIGYAGIFSMAHAVFYGVGAYVAALLGLYYSADLAIAIPVAMISGAVASLLISLPALRVRGEYFVAASLGLQVIASTIFEQWDSVTGGLSGLSGIPVAELFGYELASPTVFMIVTIVLVVFVALVVICLLRTSFGRDLRAIRDDETAAGAVGKNVTTIKAIAVAVSAALCTVGGVLYAYNIAFVNPESFTLNLSVLVMAMVIIGGAGTTIGPIVGAAIIQFLPAALSWLPLPSQNIGYLQQILYGVAMVLLMIYRPAGLLGKARAKA
ncbi:branched-chain amino acid ABC transporter permease [Brucella anthropi]|jgi:branched-chain amino acid transport system permease protein|uniref:branched-chain amino acid ABC transporter permease n=1 Tax=Brucella anthropi TaxID=529 RepID=UPI0017474332|nr:branched-chain amino acid ABC transporter permease [Brucella anthropi]QOD67106.1 branched-chain amino acid ABC transporter permease [Ochrobactrum sp. MT180101]